jgi:hypothetical protein
MVTPSAGAVILVRFPFSDLSQSKLLMKDNRPVAGRPAPQASQRINRATASAWEWTWSFS